MLEEFGETAKILPRRRKYLHWYLAGFVDAEGCFSVSIKKQSSARFGYVIDPVFHVVQSKKDKVILEVLKKVINAGRIERKHRQDELQFIIDNRRQLREKLIPFFEKYRLIVKREEFELFKEIVERLEKKEHWRIEGFKALLSLTYKLTRQKRKRSFEEVMDSLRGRESSEAIRRGLSKKREKREGEA